MRAASSDGGGGGGDGSETAEGGSRVDEGETRRAEDEAEGAGDPLPRPQAQAGAAGRRPASASRPPPGERRRAVAILFMLHGPGWVNAAVWVAYQDAMRAAGVDVHYCFHVDARIALESLPGRAKMQEHGQILAGRHAARWGERSLANAEVAALREVRRLQGGAGHYALCSGLDLPTGSLARLKSGVSYYGSMRGGAELLRLRAAVWQTLVRAGVPTAAEAAAALIVHHQWTVLAAPHVDGLISDAVRDRVSALAAELDFEKEKGGGAGGGGGEAGADDRDQAGDKPLGALSPDEYAILTAMRMHNVFRSIGSDETDGCLFDSTPTHVVFANEEDPHPIEWNTATGPRDFLDDKGRDQTKSLMDVMADSRGRGRFFLRKVNMGSMSAGDVATVAAALREMWA